MNPVPSLSLNVRRLLQTLELHDCQEWLHPFKEKLRFLEACLGRSAPQEAEAALAIEFCSIFESHPVLRASSKVVFAADLRDICEAGLAYWTDMEKRRELTAEEKEYLQVVRHRHQE